MSSRPRNPRPVGRPPGDTGDRTRGEILDAALEAFAASGFDAMSVRELTRRLGVSHNLVHHHFGSKEQLWRAALEHGLGPTVGELIALVGESVGGPNPAEVLREGMERAMALLRRRPAVARILADESARGGPRLDHLYERFLKPGMAILRRFIAGARKQGVRDVDPRIAVLFVLSAASSLLTHAALAQKLGLGPGSQDKYAPAFVELTLGGLLASPAAVE